jgi:hypothetical protein
MSRSAVATPGTRSPAAWPRCTTSSYTVRGAGRRAARRSPIRHNPAAWRRSVRAQAALAKLWSELKNSRFRPQPVSERQTAKRGGSMRRHGIPTLTGAEELQLVPMSHGIFSIPPSRPCSSFWAISAARTATSCASGCGVVTDNDVGPAGEAGRARSRRRPTPCGMSGAPLVVIGLALGLGPAPRTHQPIAELQSSGPGPPE